MTKYLAAALLSTALITGAAYAQNKTATTDSGAAMHREGEWRASKLVGVDVYNEANEKIGDINEIILDKSGKAANVILGVGGFLGHGRALCRRRLWQAEVGQRACPHVDHHAHGR